MVQCFAADCNHTSEKNDCKMFRFPNPWKSPKRRRLWKKLIRREDRSPSKNSRICRCHFKDKSSRNLPEIFARNQAKRALFSSPTDRSKKNSVLPDQSSGNLPEMSADSHLDAPLQSHHDSSVIAQPSNSSTSNTSEVLDYLKGRVKELESELQCKDEELKDLHQKNISQSCEILILQAEIDILKKELKDRSLKGQFSLSDISNKPEDMAHYTGLPNIEVFNLIFGMFEHTELTYYSKWNVNVLSRVDQLFLTLFKLCQNPSVKDLARRFNVSVGTVENIFFTWLSALHQVAFKTVMARIPSRFKNLESLPEHFNEFRNCRMVMDCTEFVAANPRKLSDQNDRFSNYKHRITFKGLVAISPNGSVTFLSDLYPGSASDKFIVQNCGILDKLEPGDSVLANKGF